MNRNIYIWFELLRSAINKLNKLEGNFALFLIEEPLSKMFLKKYNWQISEPRFALIPRFDKKKKKNRPVAFGARYNESDDFQLSYFAYPRAMTMKPLS